MVPDRSAYRADAFDVNVNMAKQDKFVAAWFNPAWS
jgi:hypothetical protein